MGEGPQRRTAQRLALALGGASVLCLGLALLAIALRPRQFTTHRDAIGYALAQRGVAYEAIYINRGWPDTLTDDFYGANLEVQLPVGRSVPGRLECRVARHSCYFSLASLGIVRQPLPDLVETRRQPWVAWIDTTLDSLARHLPWPAAGGQP